MYYGGFSSKADIEQEFSIPAGTLDPYTIHFASYGGEAYEGYAFVVYQDNATHQLYEVNGSHCSCYGLEGQWLPEETEWIDIFIRADKGTMAYLGEESEMLRGEILRVVRQHWGQA